MHNLTVAMTRDGTAVQEDSDGTPLLEIGGGPFDSPRHNPTNNNSLESGCSGYGSDSENSDVDAAVAWYKERVRVSSRGTTVIRSPPTSRSAAYALVILCIVTTCLTAIAS